MFIHYRAQGLILKKDDRGEADQLFTVFTRDYGKIKILGKAIRKISSKLKQGAEIFYLSEIEFVQAKAYKTLTGAIPIDKFKDIRKDLKKLKIAHKISGVLDNLIKGQEADRKLWTLLLDVFQKLNNPSLSASHFLLVYYYFLWNLFSILGYKPHLYDCSFCQKKLSPDKLYFNSKEGGVICQVCFLKTKLGRRIDQGIIKILRIILDKKWQVLLKLRINSEQEKSLKLVSQNYLRSVLEAIK
ncbi:MAG: DNA repair protein RecO [Candidatus Paceibacterota bacterium]